MYATRGQTGSPIRPDPWLQGRRPSPTAALRLFCFPHSGAGASVYRGWQDGFPPGTEVCQVQLPGRESRIAEPPFRRIEDAVPAIARALLPYLDRPFALFGHSLGALVIFELARHLRREHRLEPRRLFVSGHPAPHRPAGHGEVYRLPDAELAQKLREMGGTPEEVLRDPELRALLFPILRADFEMSETYAYRAEAPLDCPVTALGGADDADLQGGALEAWREETRGAFRARTFPGGHFFLHAWRAAVIDLVARDLAAAAHG